MKDLLKKISFVAKLHAAGLLSDEQEAELLDIANEKLIAATAQNPANTKKETEKDTKKEAEITEKLASNPFFESVARKELKEYFEKNGAKNAENAEDFENILTDLIKNIEAQAISGYEKQKTFENTLKTNNDNAKSKLVSQAENGNPLEINAERVFSREDLAKMSNEDYKKYEKIIHEQLLNGLIN